MPIVVRELVIRARVSDVDSEGEKDHGHRNGQVKMGDGIDLDRLVKLCVEKTLTAIKRKNER